MTSRKRSRIKGRGDLIAKGCGEGWITKDGILVIVRK